MRERWTTLAAVRRTLRRAACRLWTDERGTTAVEYALLLAMVAGGAAVASRTLGDAVGARLTSLGTAIGSAVTGSAPEAGGATPATADVASAPSADASALPSADASALPSDDASDPPNGRGSTPHGCSRAGNWCNTPAADHGHAATGQTRPSTL
jgi:Flp pilus assembly pilin Flp